MDHEWKVIFSCLGIMLFIVLVAAVFGAHVGNSERIKNLSDRVRELEIRLEERQAR